MREVTYVSKRISTARHRATPEKGATLEAMTQALGRSGRQAAVIAAASGLVLTAAPAANAAVLTAFSSASVSVENMFTATTTFTP